MGFRRCLLLFSSAFCLRLSDCFLLHQQTIGLSASIRSRSSFHSLVSLNAKGFGKSNHAEAEDNKDNIDDILLQTIAAKEAEFQAELGTVINMHSSICWPYHCSPDIFFSVHTIDKMLAEAKESNALAGKNSLDDFSNEDLSKAIMEMQQLRKQQGVKGGNVEEDVTMSEDGYQIVKLVIPPGLFRLHHVLRLSLTVRLHITESSDHLFHISSSHTTHFDHLRNASGRDDGCSVA